jgi:hypothetical protein
MTCEDVRKSLPLMLYGELDFDQEEECEVHLDECAACRQELAREKTLHRVVTELEIMPTADMLTQSRQQLRRSLETAVPGKANWWEHWREMLTIRFHPLPAVWQTASAMVLLAAGFFGARLAPQEFRTGATVAGLEPSVSRVRYVEPMANERVQIVLDETRQRVLSGSLEIKKFRTCFSPRPKIRRILDCAWSL